jgi:hypothetical protein
VASELPEDISPEALIPEEDHLAALDESGGRKGR